MVHVCHTAGMEAAHVLPGGMHAKRGRAEGKVR
jgi:hypothetical protein